MSVWDRWLRKGPENKYIDLIFEASNYYANWDPLKVVKTGDYGYLQKDGSFAADGNIFEEGLATKYGIETTKTGEDSIRWIQSVKTKEISGGAQAKVGTAPLVGVGIKKSFKIASSHGAVLVMLKPRLESIKYPGRLKALLTSSEDWNERVVISEVYTCHSYARLLAPKQSSEVEISLDGKSHAGLVGGKAKMQWKTSHEAGDFRCRHGTGKPGDVICYPLFKLVSLRARGPVLRLKITGSGSRSNSKVVEQPVTSSVASEADDGYGSEAEEGDEEEECEEEHEEEEEEVQTESDEDQGMEDNEAAGATDKESGDEEEDSDEKGHSDAAGRRHNEDAEQGDESDDEYPTRTSVNSDELDVDEDNAGVSDDPEVSDRDDEDGSEEEQKESEGEENYSEAATDSAGEGSAVLDDSEYDDDGQREESEEEAADGRKMADADTDEEESRSYGSGSAEEDSAEESEEDSADEDTRPQTSDSDSD
ncbi:hypothetical protein OBBRIDRAFT_232425 [Obba rivulosa]|uniref:Uncharacterized protein n=1 Tax=Obba rivulosa TaxID=1052685 RepID=A0A8E2J6Z4_9APHY|nr:hypothetical protein OBBRIDRAFT_232425 [Obba rivulosa]